MNRLDAFCDAIRHHEGWYPGSRSYRHSNPGNLRSSIYSSNVVDGYAFFSSFAAGWKALLHDVTCKATGKTVTSLTGESTIRDFFQVYAPSSDRNNPELYAQEVCKRVDNGLTPDSKLKELLDEGKAPE